MGVNLNDLKKGTIFRHDSGYIGEILSVTDERDIRAKVLDKGDSPFVTSSERNVFLSRIMDILSQPEEVEAEAIADAYEVEVEMPGQAIFRMDYIHFEKFLKTIQK